jgi:hypothetical protein
LDQVDRPLIASSASLRTQRTTRNMLEEEKQKKKTPAVKNEK